ncbi:MAG TPA: transporter substrate-binding domain-containing protein, partial [Stellaceae bacterium]
MHARPTSLLLALLAIALLPGSPAAARSFAAVKDSGTIALCAHPNSLPFASKDSARHGFQVELAEALARRLGVSLTRDWVITSYDIFRADCDIVMDSIADRQAQEESGLRLSKPYRRSGVAIAVRADDKSIRSLGDIDAGHLRVGVLTSSIAAMKLSQHGAELVPGLFEDEMLVMLTDGEIDAAAVTPTSAGYYNLTHRRHKVRLIYPFEAEPDLSW